MGVYFFKEKWREKKEKEEKIKQILNCKLFIVTVELDQIKFSFLPLTCQNNTVIEKGGKSVKIEFPEF